jgi:CheY-like chemotaxis protein
MAEPPVQAGTKLLVCDDDDTLVALLESILSGAGYEVVTAEDGVQCLEKFHAEKPDMLILDLDMPQKTGFEVIEQLSKEGALRDRPLLVLTGRERKEDVERAMTQGAKAFITKPFNGDTLLRMVAEILSASNPAHG